MSATTPIAPVAGVIEPHAQHIKVAIRLRPPPDSQGGEDGKKKPKGGDKKAWSLQRNGAYDTLSQKGIARKVEGRTVFHFDQIFDEETKTPLLYKSIARPMVKSVLAGRHGTMFAYGQTGSGKTFTMQGDGLAASGQAGIIQLVASDLFRFMRQDSARDFTVKLSYIEIYNEKIRDLVADGAKDSKSNMEQPPRNNPPHSPSEVTVRTSGDGNVHLGCLQPVVKSVDEVLDYLISGNKIRVVAKTDSNAQSSRSHAIFRLTIESRLKNDTEDVLRVSDFNLVDLAGSESVKTANTSGSRQREGAKINQSLLTLSTVIHALSLPPSKRQKHINYRDSNLTRILQPHLSGNAEMAILCCASASKNCMEETRSTLKFAARAKLVKMNAKINEVQNDGTADKELIAKLQAANARIKEVEAELESEREEKQQLQEAFNELKRQQDPSSQNISGAPSADLAPPIKSAPRKYTMPSSFGGKRIEDLHGSVHNISVSSPISTPDKPFRKTTGMENGEQLALSDSKFQLDAVDPNVAQEAISRMIRGEATNANTKRPLNAQAPSQSGIPPSFARDFPIPTAAPDAIKTTETSKTVSSRSSSSSSEEENSFAFVSRMDDTVTSWNSVTELNAIAAPNMNKLLQKGDDASPSVPTEILTIATTSYEGNPVTCITDQLRDAEQKASFFSEKLEQSENLVEALFCDLKRARSCIHDLVHRNVSLCNRVVERKKDGTRGAFWAEEAIMEQLWLLKGTMYASLFFFFTGGYELFVVTTILIWLILEYNLTLPARNVQR